MSGVFSGFAIIGVVIALGYLIQRTGLIGDGALVPLSRLIYFVASPCLLFTVMVKADVGVLFSRGVVVTIVSMAFAAIAYITVSGLFLRKPLPDTVIGVLASVQANAGNIGLPVAVYVLGSAQYVAPVMLLQTVVLTPTCLILLDLSTQEKIDAKTVLLQPFRNPAIIAALGGLAVAVSGFRLPDQVVQPFEIVGGASVPLFLITFGMALRGRSLLHWGAGKHEITVSTVIKAFVMPAVAFVAGRYAFHLPDAQLFPIVVVAALPTAQNVYNVAVRFGRREAMSINTIMATTVISVPVLLAVAALLT